MINHMYIFIIIILVFSLNLIMLFNILLCRKSTDYNEQSDSDEDGENKKKKRSKSLRVKFPWFKNADYQKRDEEYYILHGDSDFIDSDEDDYPEFGNNSEPVCISQSYKFTDCTEY